METRTVQEMIEEMGSIKEPWELFELTIFRDKIGDSLWHCKICSCDAILIHKTGESLKEAVSECYYGFLAPQ